MRFWINTIWIALLSLLVAQWLLWWQVVVCGFLVSVWRPLAPRDSFLSGFLGIGGLWLITAAWIDYQNASLLSEKLIDLFYLPHPLLLVVATGLVGGVAGGLGALSGCYVWRWWKGQ
jgi:hypothetical protein